MPLRKALAIRNRCHVSTSAYTHSLPYISMRTTYLRCLPLTLFFLLLEAVPALRGQAFSDPAGTVQLNQVTSFSALPNGIDLQDGDARMQIVALRQDVIRIRVSRDKKLAEDASWAVLEAARQSRVPVAAIETADAGFQTQVLRVSTSRSKFALTVSDREAIFCSRTHCLSNSVAARFESI